MIYFVRALHHDGEKTFMNVFNKNWLTVGSVIKVSLYVKNE